MLTRRHGGVAEGVQDSRGGANGALGIPGTGEGVEKGGVEVAGESGNWLASVLGEVITQVMVNTEDCAVAPAV